MDRDVVRERPVHRRGREEADLGTEVVAAGPAFATAPARHARLERDPVADRVPAGGASDPDHHAGRFMPEDERRSHT
jgi:hypothetical protein